LQKTPNKEPIRREAGTPGPGSSCAGSPVLDDGNGWCGSHTAPGQRIPAPRFDQASGPGNTDLNPTDDERRILDAARAAAVDLKRTFDNWVTMGRGLQLLRKKADLLGTRHAFNDLRHQNGLGDRFFNKTRVSRLLRVMDELEAVDKWRATLTEKIVVAELVPAVLAWARNSMVEVFGKSLTDPRRQRLRG
jgi:hypothetical protein